MHKVVQRQGAALLFAHESLRHCRELLLKAICSHPVAIRAAPIELFNDREFLLHACSTNGNVLEYLGAEHKKDWEVVSACIKSVPASFEFADKSLRTQN